MPDLVVSKLDAVLVGLRLTGGVSAARYVQWSMTRPVGVFRLESPTDLVTMRYFVVCFGSAPRRLPTTNGNATISGTVCRRFLRRPQPISTIGVQPDVRHSTTFAGVPSRRPNFTPLFSRSGHPRQAIGSSKRIRERPSMTSSSAICHGTIGGVPGSQLRITETSAMTAVC